MTCNTVMISFFSIAGVSVVLFLLGKFARPRITRSNVEVSKPEHKDIPDLQLKQFHFPDAPLTFRPILSVSIGSARGVKHADLGSNREDSFAVTQNQNQIILAICDGVSSASKAEIASKLVAAQVGEVISKVFKGRVTLDNELWIEVNRELSATLVRRYISDLDEASIALPSKSSELRLQTSETYATTLEILVIEKESKEKCKRGYLYVKVAGDGSLFKLRKRSFFQAGSIEEISGENSGNLVNALPVFDGQVEVEEGSLKRGESLVAATDGFSSALLNSDELRTFMMKNAWGNFGIKHVSKALRIASRYSRDDLTLTKVDLA